MAFDGFYTRKIVEELNRELVLGRVNKINNISSTDFIFTIRKNSTKKLLLSLNPRAARIHLTKNSYNNPKSPSNFCTLLRKYLNNAVIENIEQINNDRIISITFSSSDELGYRKNYYLFAELMGKHSNLILTDSDKKILDAVKNSYDIEFARATISGINYNLPPTVKKINPFNFNEYPDLDELNHKDLINTFYGVSSTLANKFKKLNDFKDFCENFDKFTQAMILDNNKKEDFYFIELENHNVKYTFNSFSEALDFYYLGKEDNKEQNIQNKKIYQTISSKISKNKKKIKILEKEISSSQNYEIYQIKGNLLLSNSYMFKNNFANKISLLNFYSENAEEYLDIELDTDLSIEQNAKTYFDKYKKIKRKLLHLDEQLEICKQEISYLEDIENQLLHASANDLEEIKEELVSYSYIKEKTSTQKKNKKINYTVVTYNSTPIYIGKNNIQNASITHKLAKKDYLWFHIKDIPGSHVVIFSDNPPEDTINLAAMLAAYYSKNKNESFAIVDYTKIKYVKKIPGAKPGQVTYTNQTSLKVKIDKLLINTLVNK